MKTVQFSVLVKNVNARKVMLAAAGKVRLPEELRNKGMTRTPAKRALLERAEARAEAAGMLKVISYR
jgi:hypothetical protein